MSSTAFAAAASLCGASTSSNRLMSILCFEAVALILSTGPTSVGAMMPASAASAVPRKELSSQGCTTMVAAAGMALAAAIRRSYLAPGLASGVPKAATLISSSHSNFADSRCFCLRFGVHGEQLCHAIEPARGLACDLAARRQHAADGIEAGAAFGFVGRQQFWNRGEARLRLQQQHEELLAHDALELRQRQPRTGVLGARPPQRLEA